MLTLSCLARKDNIPTTINYSEVRSQLLKYDNTSRSESLLKDNRQSIIYPNAPHNSQIVKQLKKEKSEHDGACVMELTASYVNELKLSETLSPITPGEELHQQCPHIVSSCCSSFEFESMREQFEDKKTRMGKTFEILEQTLEYVNNIGETTFSKFKFALLEKFEDKCETPHIDVQLAHLHLTLSKALIIDLSQRALNRRRSARSARACDICDYDFHRLFQERGPNPEMQVGMGECKAFLDNHAQEWIDFLNVLWELSLINRGLKCVMRESNSQDYIIQQKLGRLPHRSSTQYSKILNQGLQSDYSLQKHGFESKTPENNDMLQQSEMFDLEKSLMAENIMISNKDDRSIIQTKAKLVVQNLPNLNLELISNLPNLEEETEIDGMIKQCQVSVDPLSDPVCVNICLDWFFSNQIESQLPIFLRDVILTVKQFFYSSEEHQDDDHPKRRKEIESHVENREEIELLSFPAYLEANWTSEIPTHRVQSEGLIDLDSLSKAIVDDHTTPEYRYLLRPFEDFMDSEFYAGVSKWIVSLTALVTLLVVC